jgi:hypothetical protein
MSSAAASANSGGRDQIIGFRMCSIREAMIDSNFLLYENHSIMNTKIRITGHWSESGGVLTKFDKIFGSTLYGLAEL